MHSRALFTAFALGLLASCLGETNQHLASMDANLKTVAGRVDETTPRLARDADTVADNMQILNVALAQMAQSMANLEKSMANLEKMAGEISKVIVEGNLAKGNPPAEAPSLDSVLNPPPALGSTSFIAAAGAPPSSEALAPIQGSLCIRATAEKLDALANGFPDWIKIPESTYSIGKFQMIKLVSAQTMPWDKAVSASPALSGLPEAERATRAGQDQLAFFFFQPGGLGAEHQAIYPRFAARCTGTLEAGKAHQECAQLPSLARFGVESFTSVIEAAPSDACASDSLLLKYDVRITLASAQVQQIRDTLLGGLSFLGSALPAPAVFIRGYFENFYPGWKAYAEKL